MVMKQYIDKSVIIDEIKKHAGSAKASYYGCGRLSVCEDLLKFLDTLEVKEVDLERAIDEWICDDAITHEDCSISDVISTAKHFFELGLKVQKGE